MSLPIFFLFISLTALIMLRQRKAYLRGYDDALNHILEGTKQTRLFQPNDTNGLIRMEGMKHFYLTDLVNELKEVQWVKQQLTR